MAGQIEAMKRAMTRPNSAPANALGQKIGRDAAPKVLAPVAIAHGMKRQTVGDLAAYHHGVSVDDRPNTPLKSYEKPVAIHPGMTEQQKAKFDPAAAGNQLRAAGILSRK